MRIVVGVTGSIAAYKAAELVSKLKQKGDEIHVVMTRAATELVGPATFCALSGNPVLTELFPQGEALSQASLGTAKGDNYRLPQASLGTAKGDNYRLPHIRLAEWLDVLLICPATANIIGKIAAGIADDLLSSLVIAVQVPVIIAPAMNEKMYLSKIVQHNISILQERGYLIIEPETGYLACGYTGKGRLANLEKILTKMQEVRPPA